uniref:Vacuolar ATPase assembly factor VMA21 n=1 Tax=Buteo japonicus TaxID=224669 RepID=A0A8C0HM28_9AVES
ILNTVIFLLQPTNAYSKSLLLPNDIRTQFLKITCLLNEGSLTSTLRTLLFFTALMITLPVGLYFSSKAYIFEGTLGMSDRDSYFYAAIVAVVTVHVVLALFVYVAWNEGSRQWREGKQD